MKFFYINRDVNEKTKTKKHHEIEKEELNEE